MPGSGSQITRKQFIRTTGLATLMANSVIGFFTKTFGQFAFDIDLLDKLNVSGIYPDPADAGKKGIHLRWLFPLNLGFPKSFDIYRCDSGKCVPLDYIKYEAIINNPDHSPAKIVESEKSVFVILKHSRRYINIRFRGQQYFPVKVYNNGVLLEEKMVTRNGSEINVEFQHKEIDAFSYPLSIKEFQDFAIDKFIDSSDPCEVGGDWKKIHTIDYDGRFKDFDLKNFFDDCYNFYLPKDDIQRKKSLRRYQENLENKYYLRLVQGLSDVKPVEHLSLEERADIANLISMLSLSIIDPNIARILGLYFIDEKIGPGKKYDYRIIANYEGKKPVCGTVMNLGNVYDPLPVVADLKASQSDESFFRFNKGLDEYEQQGLCSLRWRKPSYNKKTDAVAYFLRKDPAKNQTIRSANVRKVNNTYIYDNHKGELILAAEDRENKNFYNYFDRKLKVERTTYELLYTLYGIDAYGRVGSPVTGTVKISDKSIPPAPVNLKISERATGESKRYFLNYTYGAAQYLKAPDVSRFVLLKKDTGVRGRQKIKYTVLNDAKYFVDAASGNNSFIIEVEDFEITDVGGNSINSPLNFPGKFRYNFFQPAEDDSGKKNAIKDRIKFRIIKYFDKKTFQVVTERTNIMEIQSGNGYLFADSSNPDTWNTTGIVNDFVPPQQLDLEPQVTNNSAQPGEISAKILLVRELDASFNVNSEAQTKYVELLIDLAVFQSALFNDGSIRGISNHTYTIKAQSSTLATRASVSDEDLITIGIARENLVASKLLIEDSITNAGLLAGREVYISCKPEETTGNVPLNNIKGIVKLLFKAGTVSISSEGELLLPASRSFYLDKDPNVAPELSTEDIPVTAKLLCGIRSTGNSSPAETLVFISKPVSEIKTQSARAFYFKAYETEITVHTDIIIPDGKGTASVYFTTQTIDNSEKQNKSGLSLQVQHMAYRTIAPPPPPAVYSCAGAIDGKNYLPVPNKEGRSSVCVQWDKIDNIHPPSTRFELTRALDVSIVSVFKSKWMSCDLTHIHAPNPALKPSEITALENVRPLLGVVQIFDGIGINDLIKNASTGIFEGTLTGRALSEEDRKNFTGARIKINNYYFAVTGFNLAVATVIMLRLLTPVKTPPGLHFANSLTGLVLERLPDQSIQDILVDNNKLKLVADACPEAFSMVTKVPVRCIPCTPKPGDPGKKIIQYIDNVPGTGNGRFFYKARSADAAENRSEWSVCSDAFYQVDVTAPDIPVGFKAETGDRIARLCWNATVLPDSITGFEIFRSNNAFDDNTNFNFLPATITRIAIPKAGLTTKKVAAMLAVISLPAPINIPVVTNPESTIQFLAVSIQLTENSTNLYNTAKFELLYTKDDANTNLRIRGIKIKEPGILEEGVPLRVTINNIVFENDDSQFAYVDTNLEGGKEYYYTMRTVKTIPSIGKEIWSGMVKPGVKVVGIDKSVPVAPQVLNSNWISPSGFPISIPLADSQFKMTIRSIVSVDKIVIFKRKKTVLVWEVVSIEDTSILQNWNENDTRDFIDKYANGLSHWEYSLQFITKDLRKSDITIHQIN